MYSGDGRPSRRIDPEAYTDRIQIVFLGARMRKTSNFLPEMRGCDLDEVWSLDLLPGLLASKLNLNRIESVSLCILGTACSGKIQL